MSSRFLKREIVFYTYLVALTAVLVGADFTYFNSVKESPSQTTAQMGGEALPQCHLDTTKEPVENGGASLVRFQDVVEGASEADVTIVEYFDPNCPHCKTFHETMNTLMEEYEEEVQFVFKPFPLRATSLPEIQALYVAQQEDKFSEMLEGLYERQGQGDLTEADLRAIAEEIDMNPDALISRIQENEFREQVVQQRQRAIQIGVDSTPTVLVNGHFVQSRSLDCMQTFIERAQQGTLGG